MLKKSKCFSLIILLVFEYSACQKRPSFDSVILITVDTLRADHLSCYGYPHPTSPHIDRFINKGTKFDWAFAPASSTAASHVSIMTGRYPSYHSVGIRNDQFILGDEYETLAELLREKGFLTSAIVSNTVLTKSLNLDQGFQYYDDELKKKEINRNLYEKTADQVVDKAIHQLGKYGRNRFFLWLHFQDPHGPYVRHPRYIKNFSSKNYNSYLNKTIIPLGFDNIGYGTIPQYQYFDRETSLVDYIMRYDEEIAFLDGEIARLFNKIEKIGFQKNILTIITADHGEAFGEDGFYFSHEQSVGMDQIHVPLAMIGPGIAKGNEIRNQSVSTIDIFSTILDFMEIKKPEGTQSRSLCDILQNKDQNLDVPIYSESMTQRGIIEGNYLYRKDRTVLDEGLKYWDNKSTPIIGLVKLGDKIEAFGSPKYPLSLYCRELENHLEEFTRNAEENMIRIRSARKRREFNNSKDINNLRSLGYVK